MDRYVVSYPHCKPCTTWLWQYCICTYLSTWQQRKFEFEHLRKSKRGRIRKSNWATVKKPKPKRIKGRVKKVEGVHLWQHNDKQSIGRGVGVDDFLQGAGWSLKRMSWWSSAPLFASLLFHMVIPCPRVFPHAFVLVWLQLTSVWLARAQRVTHTVCVSVCCAGTCTLTRDGRLSCSHECQDKDVGSLY